MTTDTLFCKRSILFSQITRCITQILFTEAVEVLSGRKVKLVNNVGKGDVWH